MFFYSRSFYLFSFLYGVLYIIWVDHILFTLSNINRDFGCFQLGAIMNNVAASLNMSLVGLIFWVWYPWEELVGHKECVCSA